MNLSSITFWRRICQAVCFVLLVYSGFVLAGVSSMRSQPGELGTPVQDNVLFTAGAPSLLDAYPPGAACFFVEGRRFVKGCNVYLISDALARHPALSTVLPALLVFVLLSFLLGRWWCGWVCPLSAMGDAIDALRKKLNFNHWRYPERWKSALRISSYATLAGTAGISLLIGFKSLRWMQKYLYLPFCEICPARLACPVLAGGSPSFTGGFATIPHCVFTFLMYGLLAFFVVSFLAARRLWCHFCPIGLSTSWFNRGSALELAKENVRCNSCGACVEACPMGCDHLAKKEGNGLLNHHNCVFCLRCVEQCPKEKCLSLRFLGRKIIRSRLRSSG